MTWSKTVFSCDPIEDYAIFSPPRPLSMLDIRQDNEPTENRWQLPNCLAAFAINRKSIVASGVSCSSSRGAISTVDYTQRRGKWAGGKTRSVAGFPWVECLRYWVEQVLATLLYNCFAPSRCATKLCEAPAHGTHANTAHPSSNAIHSSFLRNAMRTHTVCRLGRLVPAESHLVPRRDSTGCALDGQAAKHDLITKVLQFVSSTWSKLAGKWIENGCVMALWMSHMLYVHWPIHIVCVCCVRTIIFTTKFTMLSCAQ